MCRRESHPSGRTNEVHRHFQETASYTQLSLSCVGVRSSGYGTHTSPASVAVASGISTAGLGTVLLARAAREAFGRRKPPATVFSIAMTIEIWCDFFLFLMTLATVIVILENCWFSNEDFPQRQRSYSLASLSASFERSFPAWEPWRARYP